MNFSMFTFHQGVELNEDGNELDGETYTNSTDENKLICGFEVKEA